MLLANCFSVLFVVVASAQTGWAGRSPHADFIEEYYINGPQRGFYSDNILEDALLDVPDLIRKYNYPCEEHSVVTEDGYILGVHRIPHGRDRNNIPSRHKPVVFVMHGLFASSADWVLMGPGIGLGYILAEAGYDVWMGNARGTTYSKNHVSLRSDVFEDNFWDFTWEEIGSIDLPAMIDYALEKTGKNRLHYLGHSQGTVVFWVMGALRPEYNEKIISMQALAPVAFLEFNENRLFKILAPFSNNIENLLRSIIKEFVTVIENKNTDTNTNKAKNIAWQKIAERFNELNSRNRTIVEIKQQWRTTKLDAKKKLSNFKRERNGTGGGQKPSSPDPDTNEIIEMIPQEFEVDSNKFALVPKSMTTMLGVGELLGRSPIFAWAGKAFCGDDSPLQPMCTNMLFMIAGESPDMHNATMFPLKLAHTPAGISVRQLVHFAQHIGKDWFRRFDYGRRTNRQVYGSITPPAYDLSKVTAPVFLHYAHHDVFAHLKDLEKLFQGLGRVIGKFLVPHPQFSHLDFMWGTGAKEQVYNRAINFMDALGAN